MQARTETIDMLAGYYAAMERNRPDEFGAYYADDMTLTFGNNPPLRGRQAILDAFEPMLSQVASLGHDLVNVWEEEGGIVTFESLGRWSLHTGAVVEIKAASIITVRNGTFVDQRIYVDNTPLFEALAREGS